MTSNPAATARRNVAERIDGFLNGLDRPNRLPNRHELFWVRAALENLREGQHPAGEDAMERVERAMPIPEQAASDPATNASMTVEKLRGLPDGIMKAPR